MTIDIEKLAKENGFVTHTADDGECYADLETLKQFAEAYAAKVHDKRVEELEAKNSELSASINDLCEALEDIAKHTPENFWQNKAAQQALSKTPAQSLIEHDNEVIEKCAIVCENNDGSWADYIWNDAVNNCAKQIRALKG